MKTKDEILKEAQDHFGVNVFANDGGITRRIEHYAMDLWAKEVVKNNLDQADVNNSFPKGNFKWTDKLVSDYADYYKVRINNVGHLPYFVKDQWMIDFKKENSNEH